MSGVQTKKVGTVAAAMLALLLVVMTPATTSVAKSASAPGQEKKASSTNAFPQDNGGGGTVPQQRGQDTRASDSKGKKPAPPPPPAETRTLVLYDDDGQFGWLGELYAMAAGNLASHFGTWTAKPVRQYQAGDIAANTATIYIGSTYKDLSSPLPVSFLDDVLVSTRPVVWIYDNIWHLANRAPDFVGTYGFNPWAFDTSAIAEVRYKGQSFTRDTRNGGGVMNCSARDAAKAIEVATAVRPDGSTLPWGLRAGALTYLGENPFAYIGETDRYVVFSDLLFDALAPATVERHRALVRIEDIGPEADPAKLRALGTWFRDHRVPFSFIVYPVYKDPNGYYNSGVPESVELKDSPEVVAALKYMIECGGTMVMHGYTHQYGAVANPYNGVSGDDFEFYRAHVDPATDDVVYDGAVPEDSARWASGRINDGLQAFKRAGLPAPQIFEFPHYAGSAIDYGVVKSTFAARYDRGLYFSGLLSGGTVTSQANRMIGQFFPYPVTDVYGSKVIPESLGNYEPEAYNNHATRFPADMIATARRDLAVRDGFASFFHHWYLDLNAMAETVQGIQAAGYTFVSAASL